MHEGPPSGGGPPSFGWTGARHFLAFYEALRLQVDRNVDIVRDGQVEATNYFFSLGDDESVLELTVNRDGRTYDVGTGYGHIGIGTRGLRP